jgi:hypothetical protein
MTRKTKANSSAIDHMLLEFSKFLRDNNLEVFDCEIVAGIPGWHIATAIDVLCVDNLVNPTELCVLELKTGYIVDRMKVRTIGKSKTMAGEAGQTIPNCVHNHHQLQLWFGVEAMERTYTVKVARSYVVYLNDRRHYDAYQGAKWWNTDSSRQKLLAQLNTATRWQKK